jgi:predicted glycoside hydrolase/deacetylase ChbG (UPF0249 family)
MSNHIRKVKRRDFLKLGAAIGSGFMLASPGSRRLTLGGLGATLSRGTNPALTKFGFKETDRVLIVQASDVGMFEANMSAYTDLLNVGLITSAAALPACIWFPQIAHLARIHPSADVGINLTLTSEWDTIRWRPVSTVDPESGLLDAHGYFPKSIDDLPTPLNLEDITREFEKQIVRVQKMGIPLTHLDAHQGIGYHPELTGVFISLANKYGLPLAFLRESSPSWDSLPWMKPEWVATAKSTAGQMEASGITLLDSITDLTLSKDDHVDRIKEFIASLPAGLHMINVHAAKETPELTAITSEWKSYVRDYDAWTSIDLMVALAASNVKKVGWGVLKS